MENLRCVVAQERINLVFAVATIGVQKIWQVLREPNYGNALGSRCGLKQCILLNREVMSLVFP